MEEKNWLLLYDWFRTFKNYVELDLSDRREGVKPRLLAYSWMRLMSERTAYKTED
jgi:hypothetical protein